MDVTSSKILVVVYITVIIVVLFQMTGLFLQGYLPVACTTSALDMQITPKDAIYTDAMIVFGTDTRNDPVILTSQTGVTWKDIHIPFTTTGEYDAALLAAPDLSIVWTERNPDTTSFFISTYTNTWSEPEILFERDIPCYLKDALYYDDTLIVLWEERYIVQRIKPYHKLSTMHKAVITDTTVIEKIAIPADSKDVNGFLLKNEHVWCIVRAEKDFIRSKSVDGTLWSTFEKFTVPVIFDNIMATPEGEFGGYSTLYNHCFLYTTKDWINWQKIHVLKTDKHITAVQLAHSNNLWGIISTKNHTSSTKNDTTTYFCASTPENIQKYQEKAQNLNKIFSLQYTIILGVVVLVVLIKIID